MSLTTYGVARAEHGVSNTMAASSARFDETSRFKDTEKRFRIGVSSI